MSKKTISILGMAILALLVLNGCNLPVASVPTQDAGAIYTASAQTVEAQMTEMAGMWTPTSGIPSPTSTATSPPPTNTPQPTYTPYNTPTSTSIPCLWIQFIQDVTIPDGTTFSPGVSFKKTWRLKNVGSCTWTTDYDLVFMDGTKMSGSNAIALPYNVRYGETVDLTVNLKAPGEADIYRGNWRLRSANGTTFGLGAGGGISFWVEIRVLESGQKSAFDFAINFCSARWTNGDQTLPCPGNTDDNRGFVKMIDNPTFETGRTENEPTLVMSPRDVKNGIIKGIFPEIRIKDGDRFVTRIGCLQGYEGCRVEFRIEYRVNGGELKLLGAWVEEYDDSVTDVDVDLSPLAGKDVQFVLTVKAKGSAEDDRVFWFVPHIYRDLTPMILD